MGRGRTLVIVGFIVLLLGALGAVVFLRGGLGGGGGEDVVEATATPAITQIVVAIQNIPRGTQIVSGSVNLMQWPLTNVPPGALLSVNDALGRYARFDIPPGLPILPGMIVSSPGEVIYGPSDLPVKITAGKVAIAMPVTRLSSVAYGIKPGDRVDVLASFWVVDLDEEFQTMLQNNYVLVVPTGEENRMTFQTLSPGPREANPVFGFATGEQPSEKQRPRLVAQLTVQNAEVLGVGDWLGTGETTEQPKEQTKEGEATPEPSAPPVPDVITLIVEPQDALVLKYLRESGAIVDLVLRSAVDKEQRFSTESVTLQYMFARFQVAEPPKLPYGAVPAPTVAPTRAAN